MVSKIYGKEYIYKNIFINVKMGVYIWVGVTFFSLVFLIYLWLQIYSPIKESEPKNPYVPRWHPARKKGPVEGGLKSILKRQ